MHTSRGFRHRAREGRQGPYRRLSAPDHGVCRSGSIGQSMIKRTIFNSSNLAVLPRLKVYNYASLFITAFFYLPARLCPRNRGCNARLLFGRVLRPFQFREANTGLFFAYSFHVVGLSLKIYGWSAVITNATPDRQKGDHQKIRGVY